MPADQLHDERTCGRGIPFSVAIGRARRSFGGFGDPTHGTLTCGLPLVVGCVFFPSCPWTSPSTNRRGKFCFEESRCVGLCEG